MEDKFKIGTIFKLRDTICVVTDIREDWVIFKTLTNPNHQNFVNIRTLLPEYLLIKSDSTDLYVFNTTSYFSKTSEILKDFKEETVRILYGSN